MRHSRLEGKLQIHFTLPWLARGIRMSAISARRSMVRLIGHKALRLVECSTRGHVMEVSLPEEILADHLSEMASRPAAEAAPPIDLEKQNFLRNTTLRLAIHAREAGRCFYCLKRHTPSTRCLDHVVPRAQCDDNSYRNLVSCCLECNKQKAQCRADDFLRSLFRDRKLTDGELAGRLRALDSLSAGKLPPPLPPASGSEKPRSATPAPRAPQHRAREVNKPQNVMNLSS